MAECAICLRHREEGPLTGELVGRTKRFWIWHGPKDENGLTRLGYLRIDSDRHAPYVGDLSDEEGAELGRLRSRLAASLRDSFSAEFVFAAVAGTGIAHFHEHIWVRLTREPREVSWYDSDELLELVDSVRASALTKDLRARLQDLLDP